MSNADAPGDNYFPLRYVQIAAGIPKKDEQGNIYYEKDESGAVTLDIARVWIETASGDPTTFSGVVIARAIVNDSFDIKDAAGVYALMMVFSSLAPMLSPTFGGILLSYFSWQSIFAVLFMLGILLLGFIIFGLRETQPVRTKFSHQATIASYKFVLKEQVFMLYSLLGAFAAAVLFAYITGSSFVFMGHFGLSGTQYGVLFGVNALGFVLFANINARLTRSFDCYNLLKFALFIMLGALLISSIGVLLELGFWVFEIGIFVAIGMLGFILPNSTTLAMARFKDHSGTASAVLGTMQFGLAGVIAFSVGVLGANTPLFLALAMLVPCVLAVILPKVWQFLNLSFAK